MTGRILLPAPSEGIYVQIFTSSDEKIKAVWPGWNYAMFVKPRWHGTDIANTQQRKFVVDQAASKIDPSQEYNIELLTRNHANSRVVFNDILRVSKNDQIVIDASICQVHKLPMKRQIEKTCSADSYPESFFKQQKREFPNDGNVYLGCGSGRDLTWKCSECSRDYELWAKRHGWKQ